MLGSLALDARSASDATSGGVRCPSQHSTKMLRAALPISIAWPERRGEVTVCWQGRKEDGKVGRKKVREIVRKEVRKVGSQKVREEVREVGHL